MNKKCGKKRHNVFDSSFKQKFTSFNSDGNSFH